MVTTAMPQQQHNITPNNLSQEQDMLLLAGSKISFRDIYEKEITIPTIRGKYYNSNDVDETFVMLNGVLTSISEQSQRTDKALTTARHDAASAKSQLEDIQKEQKQTADTMQVVIAQNQDLQRQLDESLNEQQKLTTQLENNATNNNAEKQLAEKSEAYTRLLQSSSDKMREQDEQLTDMQQENENLKMQIASLVDELQSQNQTMPVDTGLQSDFDMLSYKYNHLKDLSTQRIQALEKEMTNIKELGNVK